MQQLTDLEVVKRSAIKALRAGIRLKHAIEADKEINERLPILEADIDAALAEGRPLELTLGSVLDEA